MKSIFKLFLLVFLLLSVQFSFAQTPTWKNITPVGWSGTFQSVDYFVGNGLIAIADNNYFYKSTDTGQTWTPYPKPVAQISSISLYPDHKRAYICGGSHLYQTTDAAVSWQEINYTGMPSNINIYQIYIKSEDTLLAGASDLVNGAKIYLSSNKGKTWTLVGVNLEGDNPLGSTTECFYFVNSSHGYALGDGFYAETVDGGHSWTLHVTDVNIYYYSILEIQGHSTIIYTNTQNPPTLNNALFNVGYIPKMVQAGTMVYGIYSGDFYSSSDSGKTWKIKTINSNKVFKSIAFLDQQTGVIVGDELTSYRTTDGGTTWTKYVYGGAEGFKSIYCKSKDECYILGNKSRLFHTTDGGATWNYTTFNKGLASIQFPTPDTGYISTNSYIYRTIDAGQTWSIFNQPENGQFLSFPTKDTGFIGKGWIYKTVDAGQTWNIAIDNTFNSNNGGSYAMCFRSTTEGLASGSNCLLYTNDGGNTWQVKATGIVATTILPINNNWLVANGGNVYICDKNINCRCTYADNYTLTVPIKRDSNTILLPTANDSILISKDNGNTWIKQSFPSMGQLAFGDRNTVYSLTTGIFKGVFQIQDSITSFSQTNNRSYSCTIKNDNNTSYNAKIIVMKNDSIYYQYTQLIVNGIPFTINIPTTIPSGTGYTFKILPTDTIQYSTIQSSSFTIVKDTTDVAIINHEQAQNYIIQGNRILIKGSDEVVIYSLLGQKLYSVSNSEISLPTGFYLVKCNNVIQKVVIQ